MTRHNLALAPITRYFDDAAAQYDSAALMQAQVAEKLAQKITIAPQTILDIGCGTGLVSEALARRFPAASITVIDGSPAMLQAAQRKLPKLRVIEGDIATTQLDNKFDLVVSSMALHWLPDPRAGLSRWLKFLAPQGRLCIALLADGSFAQWKNICAAENIKDGLWKMPTPDFAAGLDVTTQQETLTIEYPTAKDFLSRLKSTGAATPRAGYSPLPAAKMRHLLANAPRPFSIDYRVLYLLSPPQGNI